MTQEQAFSVLKSGQSVFLTGPAGSGKTFLLKRFIKYLHAKGKKVSVTATTGLAATHLNGRTIHSWAGIGIKTELDTAILDKIYSNKLMLNDIKKTEVLIIDEVSMLHDYRLDMIDEVCRRIRDKSDQSFGGLQVVLSGDFFQLPPINKSKEESGGFIVNAQAWHELKPAVCYLNEQYRQTGDNDLIEILNALRNNSLNEQHILKLQSRQLPNPGDLTELHCHNLDIDHVNQNRLNKLEGREYVFRGSKKDLTKDESLVMQLIKNCIASEELRLKRGALVMFVKNDIDGSYINGTLGKVVGFQTANGYPVVETNSGRIIRTDRATWTIERNGLDLASFKQIPLKLAWAITIHKSQGMTLDGAFMDLSKTFEPGMGYVALSRLKNLKDLYLKSFNQMALKMNPEALKIDHFLKKSSKEFLQRN